MTINSILWIQDSIKNDSKLYLNNQLIPHSDKQQFYQLYKKLCTIDHMKRINKESKCEIYVKGRTGNKTYVLRGHYDNRDENGRRMPFMAHFEHVESLKVAKEELLQISSLHGFKFIETDIIETEKKEKNLLLKILTITFIVVSIAIIGYTINKIQ